MKHIEPAFRLNHIPSRLFISSIILFTITNCSHQVDRKIIHPLDTYPAKLIPSSIANYDAAQVYSQIYETLLKLGPDGRTITGNLARNWEYSDSNRCLQIELQKGIPFHDGSRLDAKAAKLSIEWLKDNTISPFLSIISKVDTIGPYTFRIHFSRPDARFLHYLASRIGVVMISPKTIANHTVLEYPAGTGPFSFTSRDSVNIIFSAFKEYRQRKGNVNKIIFKYFPYSNKLKKAFFSDKVDLIYMVDGYSIDRFQWSGKMKYLVQTPIFTNIMGFNLNNIYAGKNSFRQAVNDALDLRKIYLNMNRGGTIPAINPLTDAYPGFSDIKQDPYNNSKARKLIDHLNIYLKKIPFVYLSVINVGTREIEHYKSTLGKAGIHIQTYGINSYEKYDEAIKSDTVALFQYGWRSDIIGDPGYYLYSLFYSNSRFNVFHYKNDMVDQLLLKSQSEFDPEKRHQLYRRILKLVLKDKPVVFLAHAIEFYAYNSQKIKSISMDPYGVINYKDMVIDEDN